MVYIEDILSYVRHEITAPIFKAKFNILNFSSINSWEEKFIKDVSSKVNIYGLTEKQLDTLIKVFNKIDNLDKVFDSDELNDAIYNKKCRYEVKPSYYKPKEIRYIGDSLLAISSKYDDELIHDLRRITTQYYFDREYRVSIIYVTCESLDDIIYIVNTYNMGYDEEFERFLLNLDYAKHVDSKINDDGEKLNIEINNNPLLWFVLKNRSLERNV